MRIKSLKNQQKHRDYLEIYSNLPRLNLDHGCFGVVSMEFYLTFYSILKK